MKINTALVLPTSGTTGAPKLVALSRDNIDASVKAWVSALRLTAADRCLNIMPVWHGALISNVLSSQSVGGTVINIPGNPDPTQLWELIKEFHPTWLPLPVGLAQQVLGSECIYSLPNRLRFIRLSKASLSADEVADLEHIFDCSVLQSYGMTEAASGPVACETMEFRRPGSVGKPIHLEVRIERGQVLVRGSSVMSGYVAGPPDIFTFAWSGPGDRWLCTGDLGYFDRDGFLYLTGRI